MTRARGSTLIEAMITVALLGIIGHLAFAQVNETRKSAALTRRAARALSCAQGELERLRLEPAAALKRRVGKVPVPERCDAPWVQLKLSAVASAGVPDGTFVLAVDVPVPPAHTRTVELPFLAVGGGP